MNTHTHIYLINHARYLGQVQIRFSWNFGHFEWAIFPSIIYSLSLSLSLSKSSLLSPSPMVILLVQSLQYIVALVLSFLLSLFLCNASNGIYLMQLIFVTVVCVSPVQVHGCSLLSFSSHFFSLPFVAVDKYTHSLTAIAWGHQVKPMNLKTWPIELSPSPRTSLKWCLLH